MKSGHQHSRGKTPSLPFLPPLVRKAFQLGIKIYRRQFGRSSFFNEKAEFVSFFSDELEEFFRRQKRIVHVS